MERISLKVESTRIPPMWPGFDFCTPRHMRVEFVVGSRPCSERFFSGYSGFSLPLKTNISRFQFDLESEGHMVVSLKCHDHREFSVIFYLFFYLVYLPHTSYND